MFNLVCDITIGQKNLSQVHSVMIEKSWLKLTDRAVLKFPRVHLIQDQRFREGDPVRIKLGYDEVDSRPEFVGYVKRIKPGIPLEIECEDPSWLFRRVNINKTWEGDHSLEDIVFDIIDQVNDQREINDDEITVITDLPTVTLTDYPITNVTAAEAINELKKVYGLGVYFDQHELYMGIAYKPVLKNVHYRLGQNVIKNQLAYRREDDVKLKVTAKSVLKNNQILTQQVGDPEGEERTLFFYDIKKVAELRAKAEVEIKKYKYTGFDGFLTSFLIPYAQPNMTAILEDPDYPERNGRYVIDSVTTTFGVSGARRKVELGIFVGKGETQTNED